MLEFIVWLVVRIIIAYVGVIIEILVLKGVFTSVFFVAVDVFQIIVLRIVVFFLLLFFRLVFADFEHWILHQFFLNTFLKLDIRALNHLNHLNLFGSQASLHCLPKIG